MENNEEGITTDMIERAVFGEQVAHFMNSEIGIYIKARSNALVEESLNELRTCDAENAGKIREHQNSVVIAESVVHWLQDAISDGLKAIQIIESRE